MKESAKMDSTVEFDILWKRVPCMHHVKIESRFGRERVIYYKTKGY
jgi:hypothetical protein